ncbi:sporulation protein [Altererythrobacter indicus]|uniref:Sporulation protein n=1 Tax=Altericroceibacterium indicum TaxID=374177 RepID=A0A845AB59_9SPHN|nr:SPOR domain-containing protein [Altericroceibacterium indicum]MXP25786.1 sporulation protein [Altericroceibacterium indicum]
MRLKFRGLALGLSASLLFAAPALATVKDGVDAWSDGDYATAVAEWREPAAQGDADALFNLAQAYRLGRGVPENKAQAEQLYKQAAAKGHIRAADTYGLMLFQDGRREEALPLVEAAAKRGDPRSQYLLGIAYFNGDFVKKDWVRAYALLTLANSEGLPQARPAIAQMDDYIPLNQRQEAAGLASSMRAEADRQRRQVLASADLAANEDAPVNKASAPQPAETRAVAHSPASSAPTSDSIAVAEQALEDAHLAKGTENPRDAGAFFAKGNGTALAQTVAAAPKRTMPAPVKPAPASKPDGAKEPRPVGASAQVSTVSAGGKWRVQLGAFSVPGNAERLWAQLHNRPELRGHPKLLVPAGRVNKLQAGGYASRGAAQSACNALKQAGQDCLVTSN